MTQPPTFTNTNPYLIIPVDLPTRIAAELREKYRLMSKHGYLSRYNFAIRLMFLYYLEKGMDVRPDKIHPAFRHFIAEELGQGYQAAYAIIQARHRLKYDSKRVDISTTIKLQYIIDEIN